jgi:hypothetical protein
MRLIYVFNATEIKVVLSHVPWPRSFLFEAELSFAPVELPTLQHIEEGRDQAARAVYNPFKKPRDVWQKNQIQTCLDLGVLQDSITLIQID